MSRPRSSATACTCIRRWSASRSRRRGRTDHGHHRRHRRLRAARSAPARSSAAGRSPSATPRTRRRHDRGQHVDDGPGVPEPASRAADEPSSTRRAAARRLRPTPSAWPQVRAGLAEGWIADLTVLDEQLAGSLDLRGRGAACGSSAPDCSFLERWHTSGRLCRYEICRRLRRAGVLAERDRLHGQRRFPSADRARGEALHGLRARRCSTSRRSTARSRSGRGIGPEVLVEIEKRGGDEGSGRRAGRSTPSRTATDHGRGQAPEGGELHRLRFPPLGVRQADRLRSRHDRRRRAQRRRLDPDRAGQRVASSSAPATAASAPSDVERRADVHTGDGSVHVDDADGALDVDTGDGSVEVAGNLGAVKLHTGDGSIVYRADRRHHDDGRLELHDRRRQRHALPAAGLLRRARCPHQRRRHPQRSACRSGPRRSRRLADGRRAQAGSRRVQPPRAARAAGQRAARS